MLLVLNAFYNYYKKLRLNISRKFLFLHDFYIISPTTKLRQNVLTNFKQNGFYFIGVSTFYWNMEGVKVPSFVFWRILDILQLPRLRTYPTPPYENHSIVSSVTISHTIVPANNNDNVIIIFSTRIVNISRQNSRLAFRETSRRQCFSNKTLCVENKFYV